MAFIIFAKRNNEKEILLKKLDEIFEENYLLIVPTCSDVSQTENIYKFCVELVAYPKVYFKKLNQKFYPTRNLILKFNPARNVIKNLIQLKI